MCRNTFFSGVINRLLPRGCFTERPQALGLTWKRGANGGRRRRELV